MAVRSPYEPQIESLEALLAKRELTTELLCDEAREFSEMESTHGEPSLFGVTDGKAVGTYLEHKFQAALHHGYIYQEGSSAKGIDFPGLGVDLKVTSHKQPQSYRPYKSARQKIYGLGYSLLVFVYDETVEANRKLRTLATILATACLMLGVLLLRVATVEPPRPIVVRVDEVGRAEAVAYEAATAQADPLDPTTKYFLNRRMIQ